MTFGETLLLLAQAPLGAFRSAAVPGSLSEERRFLAKLRWSQRLRSCGRFSGVMLRVSQPGNFRPMAKVGRAAVLTMVMVTGCTHASDGSAPGAAVVADAGALMDAGGSATIPDAERVLETGVDADQAKADGCSVPCADQFDAASAGGGSLDSIGGYPTTDTASIEMPDSGGSDPGLTTESTGWRMPNPRESGLPNPHDYEVTAETVVDRVTGMMWQRTPPSGSYSQVEARSYCADLTLAGQSDWRLPSRLELVSLVDFSRAPAIDPVAFPDALKIQGWFWSASPLNQSSPSDGPRGWTVNFRVGDTNTTSTADYEKWSVRCVRGGPHATGERYLIQAGTVKDAWTGLVWQNPNGSAVFRWSEAQQYCASLELQGKGWRAPSMKELQTIVDDSRRPPGTASAAVFVEPSDYQTLLYWSSSQAVYKPGGQWYVDFGYGQSAASGGGVLGLGATIRVRCVR